MKNVNWKTRAEVDLGVSLGNWRALSGGDFAQAYCATVTQENSNNKGRGYLTKGALSHGAMLFIKTHVNPPPKHFSTEALGLKWLAQTDTVRVPEVIGLSDDAPYLATAWVDEASGKHLTDDGETLFGQQLAALHQASCTSFGREDNRSTGSLGLPNAPSASWAEFYATQRLLPLAKIAAERQALNTKLIAAIEELAGKLSEWESPNIKPSRLHGDLWAGNRLVDTDGVSWVVDPASHGGHREFDLAMMRLFGGFSDLCFIAYNEVYKLDAGWQQRLALHQLAPLIVHAIKFGDAYVGSTREALSQYVSVA